MWVQPTARRFTSEGVLAEEEYVLTWAMAAQDAEPAPSTTVDRDGLDVLQAAAAAAVAGDDRLVLVVGPAGAGKTRMLAHAAVDLHGDFRDVFGLAPTAKAARVLERDTGIHADTVAKLLHEWRRTDRPPDPLYRLPAGTTVIVDEAGAISTPALHQLVQLAERQRLAARPGRRSPPTAGGRAGRPVRRALRQRPGRAPRTPPPVPPRLGG